MQLFNSNSPARTASTQQRAPLRARLLHVAAYVCGLGIVSLATLRFVVPAQAQQLMMLGEGMPSADYLPLGITSLTVNGARFELHNARTKRSVAEVLDGFAALCSLDGDAVRRALASDGAAVAPQSSDEVPVARLDPTPAEGIASCFAPVGSAAQSGLLARARAFMKSQRLDEFGRVRLVLARRSGNTTHVLHLWSDGALDLKQMFPKQGHAPGVDIAPGLAAGPLQRALSFSESTGAYGFTSYASKESPSATDAHVATQLHRAGFRALQAPRGITIPAGLRGFQNGEELVVTGARVQNGQTVVGVMRLGLPTEQMP